MNELPDLRWLFCPADALDTCIDNIFAMYYNVFGDKIMKISI